MKYRLKEGTRVVAVFPDGFKEMEGEIEKDVKRMSFYRENKKPVLTMGNWPGIALWKVKVLFTTDVEKDFNYKTEEVKE
jgi:hypothetical protein